MTKRLRWSGLAGAAMVIAGGVGSAYADDANAKLAAVLVYADWCGSCQVLDPTVDAVKAGGPIDGVSFVRLDYTERNDADFAAAAEAADVSEALDAFMGDTIKTGQLLLVDLDDARVIGKVSKDFDQAQIEAAVRAALAAS